MGGDFSISLNRIFQAGIIWLLGVTLGWAEQSAVTAKTRLPKNYLKITGQKTLPYWQYLLYLPDAYQEKKDDWPMIVFLHGRSLRGNDIKLVKRYGPPSFLDKIADFPFIVVSPQLPDQIGWPAESLLELLDEIVGQYRVDTDRIYLTGVSMGAGGVWDLAAADQKRFAAIAPICGYGNCADLRKLNDTTVWAFHGDADQVVPIGPHQRLIDGVNQVGGKAKLTVIKGGNHGDIIFPTYKNPELYNWFMTQTRALKKVEPIVAIPVESPDNDEKKMMARLFPGIKQHVVTRGDSLWGLSQKYNVTVQAIKKANALKDDTIRVNQTLVIPSNQSSP